MEDTDVTDTAGVTTAADTDADTTAAANTADVSTVPTLPRLRFWVWGTVVLGFG